MYSTQKPVTQHLLLIVSKRMTYHGDFSFYCVMGFNNLSVLHQKKAQSDPLCRVMTDIAIYQSVAMLLPPMCYPPIIYREPPVTSKIRRRWQFAVSFTAWTVKRETRLIKMVSLALTCKLKVPLSFVSTS